MLELQELGGWESTKVARDYLAENVTKKVSIARKLQVGNASPSASTSKEKMDQGSFKTAGAESTRNVITKATEELPITKTIGGVNFGLENCSDIVVHIH